MFICANLATGDPRHLFTQPELARLPDNVYIPSFLLRKGAKLTDILSFPINNNWVVSKRSKLLLEEENISSIQLFPIKIFDSEGLKDYYILRSLKSSIEQIDFSKTEISIMKTTWDEEKKVSVRNALEFSELLEKTKYRSSIKIKRPYIKTKCGLKFFSIKYVYGVFPHFISYDFKAILEKNNITGIRYMELEEI